MQSPKKYYGFRVLVATSIFAVACIGYVIWDERRQRQRRRVNIMDRLHTPQQNFNMDEYREQQRRYEENLKQGKQINEGVERRSV